MNTRGLARLGMLAVGLGVGAGWAHMPVASADTSSDWLSAVDSFFSGAVPALAAPAVTDFQISFNGTDLFPTVGNEATATTVAGQFGLAIAFGNGANAVAEGGTGNYALADGTNAFAGAGSTAIGASGNNYDAAYDFGNNTGFSNGAFAGAASLSGPADNGTSSHDTAIDIGNNTGFGDGAFAGDGGLFGVGTAGNGDTAYTYGNIVGDDDGSGAFNGDNNYASMSGTETGIGEGAYSADGTGNSVIADVNITKDFLQVTASGGNNNYAYVYGPDNSIATAGSIHGPVVNNDIAYVYDPFSGATGPADSAVSGGGFSNDLAEVLLTHGNATADSANLLYDIVSLFGNFSGSL